MAEVGVEDKDNNLLMEDRFLGMGNKIDNRRDHMMVNMMTMY